MAVPQQIMGNSQDQQPFLLVDPIATCTKLCVKQEFAAIELCGIEAKNRYRICTDKPETQGGQQCLFVLEKSECCERVCCSACRTYSLQVHAGLDGSAPVILTFEKRFHCPMMPCPVFLHPGVWPFLCPMACAAMVKTPEMTIKEGNIVIGTVFDPPCPVFKCQMDACIRNAKGEEVFHTGPTSMCSCGMFCPCCKEERVPITRNGEMVAEIVRIQLSCAEMCGKMNRFEINFGNVTDPTERKLIMGAGFLLDTQYWDQKG